MADGKVVLDTGLDNSGVEKGIKQMEGSTRSAVMKIAQTYRKQGMSMSDAMKKAWSEVEHTSKASSKKVGNNIRGNIGGSLESVSGSFGGLKSIVGKLGATIAAAFSARQIVQFGTESVRAANELANALKGLQSIMEGQGRSFSAAKGFIEEYTKDGLIPATNAITAYKNLAMRGYDDSQIMQVMNALKDASAFGRQASYSMGEAVQSATEGLKNENSILVDNAGVTKNVAKMWEEYANSIGTTANNLTQQQKIQAEVSGILEESKYQAGDAQKVAGTFSGQLSQLSFNFNKLKVAVGNAIIPIAQQLLPVVSDAVIAMTGFANSVASVVAAFFGKADITTTNEAIAKSALDGADAEKKLEENIKKAGKAAKKSLAGFDELNILQSGGSSDGASGAAGNSSASAGSIAVEAKVEDKLTPQIQSVVDKIKALIEPLKNIDFTPAAAEFGKLGQAAKNLGSIYAENLEWVWYDLLVPLSTWAIEELGPQTVELLTAKMQFLGSALKPVSKGIQDLFAKLSPVFAWIKGNVHLVIEKAIELYQKLAAVIEEKGSEIEGILSGLGDIVLAVWRLVEPIATQWRKACEKTCSFMIELIGNLVSYVIDCFSGLIDFIAGVFTGDWDRAFKGLTKIFEGWKEFVLGVWESVKTGAEGAWKGVKKAFSGAGRFFSDTFTEAWEKVKKVFSPFGEVFVDIKDGIVDAFKKIVNGLISGINAVVATPFNGINSALNTIKSVNILGIQPFSSLKTISVPQIPYLAKGAVIPPNAPFTAVLGDQRHGTNIEAPLDTIKQAVAEVLGDFISSNVAGHEATVAVLQQILEAVLGIEIGPETVAEMVNSYNRKMAIVRGQA